MRFFALAGALGLALVAIGMVLFSALVFGAVLLVANASYRN